MANVSTEDEVGRCASCKHMKPSHRIGTAWAAFCASPRHYMTESILIAEDGRSEHFRPRECKGEWWEAE